MASWSEVESEAPELATAARARLEAHTHHTIGTLRKDGAPRISGIECHFAHGELWTGSMPNAVKALDLRRDPRYSLHSHSEDPPEWSGDARVSGRAQEITEPGEFERVYGREGGDAHLFRLDVDEVVVVSLNDARDKLLIDSWVAGRGLRRIER